MSDLRVLMKNLDHIAGKFDLFVLYMFISHHIQIASV